MKDLSPAIHRQRLVIEGLPTHKVTDVQIIDYLKRLSDILHMRALNEPVAHKSERYGWAGWIHWESSGAHFYAWDQPTVFLSVDIYTCKPFIATDAVTFTRDYFSCKEIVFKEF